MSGFKLSLCVALAATPLAAGAESQPCVACFAAVPVHPAAPAVAQVPVAAVPVAPAPHGCLACQVPSRIEIRDQFGKVRALMSFSDGEEGKRPITFFDPSGKEIITIAEPPPPVAVTGANPLSGAQIPDVLGPDEGKADTMDDIQFLKDQIKALKAQVRMLTDRINAAASK